MLKLIKRSSKLRFESIPRKTEGLLYDCFRLVATTLQNILLPASKASIGLVGLAYLELS